MNGSGRSCFIQSLGEMAKIMRDAETRAYHLLVKRKYLLLISPDYGSLASLRFIWKRGKCIWNDLPAEIIKHIESYLVFRGCILCNTIIGCNFFKTKQNRVSLSSEREEEDDYWPEW